MPNHTVVWFDLEVANLERAVKFYSKVLDKELAIVHEHGFSMAPFPHDNGDVAGCLLQAYDFVPSATGLLIYLNVNKRIDEAVRAVTANGGKVIEEVSSIGPWGFRAIILDSEGNKIALHSYDRG